MNVPTLGEVRDAIRATLGVAVPALTVYDTVPDQVNLPCVVTVPVGTTYTETTSGDDVWTFDLHVLVSRSDTGLGQDSLDGFVSSSGDVSIPAAVRRFVNLGLDDADVRAHITLMSNYGAQMEAAGVEHIAATLRLIVAVTVPRG